MRIATIKVQWKVILIGESPCPLVMGFSKYSILDTCVLGRVYDYVCNSLPVLQPMNVSVPISQKTLGVTVQLPTYIYTYVDNYWYCTTLLFCKGIRTHCIH